MQNSIFVQAPAGYVPAYAVGFSDPSDTYVPVTDARPLPVVLAGETPAPEPLAGETATNGVVGPFAAVAGRVITLSLDGEWEGTISLLRSTDGGATMHGLRVAGEPWGQYVAPGVEQAWLETEAGASFFLDIVLASGTVAYRVSQ